MGDDSHESRCRYEFVPEEWEEEHETAARLSEADLNEGDRWRCPYEPYEDEEFCLVHLDPGRREELGIPSEEVTERLNERITRGDRRFIGATVHAIDLRYVSLDSRPGESIDLRHADVSGEVLLSDANVGNELLLGGARVERLDASGATLSGVSARNAIIAHADFEGTAFRDDATFSEAGFARADFSEATFSKVWFRDASFSDETEFVSAEFEGTASFRGAEFDEDAVFLRAVFEGFTTFQDATFAARFNADYARFESITLFDSTEIRDEGTFKRAEFVNTISFEGAEFGKVAFTETAFEAGVAFPGTEFSNGEFTSTHVDGRFIFDGVEATDLSVNTATIDGSTEFTDVTVRGTFEFDLCTVDQPAKFENVEFAEAGFRRSEFDMVDFTDTLFRGDVTFVSSSFGGWSGFSDVEFRGEADFSDVTFEGHVTFGGPRGGEVSTVRDPSNSATFADEATFKHARFEGQALFIGVSFSAVDFDDASFSLPVVFRGAAFERAGFARATFHAQASFEDATFAGDVSFYGARFDHDALVTPVTFKADADFTRAEFDGWFFLGEFSHDRTPPGRDGFEGDAGRDPKAAGGGSVIGTIDLQRARIERGVLGSVAGGPKRFHLANATLGDVALRTAGPGNVFESFLFDDTRFEEFDFARPLHFDALESSGWTIHTLRSGDPGLDASDLESTYRKAKMGATRAGNNKAASEFFIKEMRYRRRRHRERGDWWKRAANKLFDVTAGYGERPRRVLAWSIGAVVAFAFVYATVLGGMVEATGAREYLLLSLQSFTSFILGPPALAESAFWLQFTSAVEGFAGAFFVALFVFALTRSAHR